MQVGDGQPQHVFSQGQRAGELEIVVVEIIAPHGATDVTRDAAVERDRVNDLALAAHFERQGVAVDKVQLMANKLLELAGFPGLSARWPYAAWRLADALMNKIVRKPAFLCMLGIRGA